MTDWDELRDWMKQPDVREAVARRTDEDGDGFPDEPWTDEDLADEGLSPCECPYCACSQLTRHSVCDDCAAGIHQG